MLSNYDYLVIGFYFTFMLAIGWIFHKFTGNVSDYFRGGGKMLWWLVGSSAFMVQFSAWTFTGGASKAYADGTLIMVIYLSNAAGFFLNYLYFAPRFRQLRVITAMEGVRDRFGRANEQCFTWLQVPMGVFYAGIWLNGLAVFIAAVFGLDLVMTIVVVGMVVLLMSVVGGSWAVVAGDFMQMLILMLITVVAAILAIKHVGGLGNFVAGVPPHHFKWALTENATILPLWIIAILIKQIISTNNMLEASRYLNAKDSSHARRGALLATGLFLIGPIVWFVPPMAARIAFPDIATLFPRLNNPSEAAFVAICQATMPAGMIGLLVSGIFAATMSSMDTGLNRNAGILIKNFYQPVFRPLAADKELLLAGKITTAVLGSLVILAALTFSTWKNIGLFDLMLQFGALVALPYSVPLLLGTLVKGTPKWAAWSTMLVGLASSLVAQFVFNADWVQSTIGWHMGSRERSDWGLLSGVFLNSVVGSAWFFGIRWFARSRDVAYDGQVDEFFHRMAKPVDFENEIGQANDTQQFRVLGLLCLTYGGFVCLLMLIPNPWTGRLCFLFCGGLLMLVGWLLRWAARRLTPRTEVELKP